jgi:hypothetical protein
LNLKPTKCERITPPTCLKKYPAGIDRRGILKNISFYHAYGILEILLAVSYRKVCVQNTKKLAVFDLIYALIRGKKADKRWNFNNFTVF